MRSFPTLNNTTSPYFSADSTRNGNRRRANSSIVCPGKSARGPGGSPLACCAVATVPAGETRVDPVDGGPAHRRAQHGRGGDIARPMLILVNPIPGDERDER